MNEIVFLEPESSVIEKAIKNLNIYRLNPRDEQPIICMNVKKLRIRAK